MVKREDSIILKKTLFLNPPSFDGFDSAAGARYPAKREITSNWYPTWLAQSAALVSGSKLIDAPPHHMSMIDVLRIAADYELIVIHTSSPSLSNDIKCAAAIKSENPHARIGFVGAHVTVLPEQTLLQAPMLDFVCRGEFDNTCLELARGDDMDQIKGLTYRTPDGAIGHTPEREMLLNPDCLPSVFPVYYKDLNINNYFIGYLLHPYVSFFSGRGCPSKCTFCLWPQTIGGHKYRAKSPAAIIEELQEGVQLFPQAREWFFDDDTFTVDKDRAIEISKGLARLKLTWSCNARVNVDYDTLKHLRANGLRLLVAGFESGSQEILNRIKKGTTLDMARKFMRNCRQLGIKVHGTFMIGLPIETEDTIEKTIRFAQELDPYTIQVSIAAPFPGTEFHDEAFRNGWLDDNPLLTEDGIQMSTIHYPGLCSDQIEDAAERLYRQFYFRMKPIFRMLREMSKDRRVLFRRLREGREFLQYLNMRKDIRLNRKPDG
jgi:hopanoid biosynthesis associated radical SAM protein HpnJ